MKPLHSIIRAAAPHWVGDGFPVSTLFSYARDPVSISPFLLLDYAAPHRFEPSDTPRGVGQHPHRGFETVTIVYQGAVDHHDNAGNHGSIAAGDVQWMTAGRGILHQEYHGESFTRDGGTFEVVQLWVNLPARHKSAAPGYQTLLADTIPTVPLPSDAGTARIIAGELYGAAGPAKSFTPVNLWDISLKTGRSVALPITDGHIAMLLVRQGEITLPGGERVHQGELAQFDRAGSSLTFTADADTALLLLSGQPIDEPVIGHGPFVMNSEAEIKQAYADYREGKF